MTTQLPEDSRFEFFTAMEAAFSVVLEKELDESCEIVYLTKMGTVTGEYLNFLEPVGTLEESAKFAMDKGFNSVNASLLARKLASGDATKYVPLRNATIVNGDHETTMPILILFTTDIIGFGFRSVE